MSKTATKNALNRVLGARDLVTSQVAVARAKRMIRGGGDVWKKLQEEFPDWPLGDLKDAAQSVSPSMSSDAQEVQKRYQQLVKGSTVRAAFKLTPKDKKVIDAFLDKKAAEGTKLSTNGKSIDIAGMGGKGAAVWKSGKVHFPDLGSKTAQIVERAVRKAAPKNALAARTVTAATDRGDKGGDKRRRAALSKLIEASTLLEEMLVGNDGFPEVKGAILAVKSLTDLSGRLDAATLRLQSAPSKSEESIEAQAVIDDVRSSIDTMLPPLMATVETMEVLIAASAALETQYAEMDAQCKALALRLEGEKKRLSSAAKAVQNAVRIG